MNTKERHAAIDAHCERALREGRFMAIKAMGDIKRMIHFESRSAGQKRRWKIKKGEDHGTHE